MIKCANKPNALYFSFEGELDESKARRVREYMDQMLDRFSTPKIVLDMQNLTFMDSTGIGILIGRYQKIAANHRSAFILNPSNSVDKLLTLSGIYQIMPKIERKP